MTKTKRHSAEQIIRKLREADTMVSAGKSVGEVIQKLGVRENRERCYGCSRRKVGGCSIIID